jgi:hypothetical protein
MLLAIGTLLILLEQTYMNKQFFPTKKIVNHGI